MMTKEQFAKEMQARVQKEMGDEYEAKIQHVTKNNGVELTGLMVNDKSNNIAPTIYLDSMYEDVINGGRTVDEVASLATYNLKKGMPQKKIDMDFFTDYEQVKDKICFRVVNAEANKKALADVPHEKFKDLAVTFFYPFEHDEIGKGSILIRNEHVQRWGVSAEDLMEVAKINTPRLFPPECMPMESVLMERMTGFGAEHYPEVPERPLEAGGPEGMMILTNGDRTFGASVLFYEGYFQRVAEAAQCDLFVIPSSVHELLILPKTGEEDAMHLSKIIGEVNANQVDPQEVLSGSLYAYDRESQSLSIAVTGEQVTAQGQKHDGGQAQDGSQGQTAGQGDGQANAAATQHDPGQAPMEVADLSQGMQMTM